MRDGLTNEAASTNEPRQRNRFAGVFDYRSLDNGLRVVLQPRLSSPVVTINLLYHVGSGHEGPGSRGYAHLLEHLMFDGSRSLKRGEYDRLCARAGGENNAWTSHDLTDYWITLPAGELELGLFLESDRMAGFHISEDSLETQKRVIAAEKLQVIDNVPYGDQGIVMRELMYAEGHPYRHEPIGLIPEVEQATLADLDQFFSTWYVPANATLAIAGSFDPEKCLELVEKYFAPLPTRSPQPARGFPDASLLLSGGRAKEQDGQIPLNGTFLSWHLPDLRSDDMIPLELLGMALADGDGSRLTLGLEYDPVIASESSAGIEEGELGSIFYMYAIAQNNRISPARLEKSLRNELQKIVGEGITEQELRRLKNRKISALVQSLQSASTRAEQLAWYALLFDDPDLLRIEAERFEEVEAEEIVAIASTYLLAAEPTVVEYRPVRER